MKSEHQFTQALKETPTFKSFERFKQGITLKRSNVINLYDKYQHAQRYGIDYLKQNQNILANDVKMIGEVLGN
jgi:lipopolysaccharide biosynthesis glycosyltransferase